MPVESIAWSLATMDCIDLHCHSTASDGTFPPAEVARLAGAAGLCALSLTDHDTIAGLAEAQRQCQTLGIDFLPGIEISAQFPYPGMLHILGYGIDTAKPVLADMTRWLLDGRNNRNPKIVARLRELGVAITLEEVEQEAKGEVVGRPHIAAILQRKGYVSSRKHAFDKYLAPGGLAWFDKERFTGKQAIHMILQAGGLPVLAHPVQLRCDNDAQLHRIVKDLIDDGLAGIEVLHCDHTPALVEKFTRIADHFHLLKTGGSDFHGHNKQEIRLGYAGRRRIPRRFYDDLITHLSSSRH